MQKKNYIVIGIVVLGIVALYFLFRAEEVKAPIKIPKTLPTQLENLGNKDDLISFSILPGTKVHGVLSYRGEIKGGYFFEANILINILDINKKVIKKSNAVAKTDWMTSGPVSFEGNVDFSGLPPGPAYLEIHNDNASGLPENDKSILIPIIIE